MTELEFLIPRRPVSGQTKSRRNLQAWKSLVRDEALRAAPEVGPLLDADVNLTLVYLCNEADPVDADNIIKPIQDALVGLAYGDDVRVADVESHRRRRTGAFDAARLPEPLVRGLLLGGECVYVRVRPSKPLEALL